MSDSLFCDSHEIFTIPVDGKDIYEDNSTFSSKDELNLNYEIYFSINFDYKYDIKNEFKKEKEKNEDNIIEQVNNNKENYYILSDLDKKKYNSEINSSKIYSCDYLRNNWKNRAKLFLNKMKKRYTKKVVNKEI